LFANIFFYAVGLPFHFVQRVLHLQRFSVDVVPFVYFCFCFPCQKRQIFLLKIYTLLRLMSKCLLPVFSSKSFVVSELTFIFLSILSLLLYRVWESTPVWFFCMYLSRFLNTIYWRATFPIVYSSSFIVD